MNLRRKRFPLGLRYTRRIGASRMRSMYIDWMLGVRYGYSFSRKIWGYVLPWNRRRNAV